MQDHHTTSATIFGVEIEVELCDARKTLPDGVGVRYAPLPVAQWPLTVDEISRRAEAALAPFGGGDRSRADLVWALAHAGEAYLAESGERYCFGAVPTAAELREMREAAKG